MQSKSLSKQRKYVTSQDLKKRLYENGINKNSMPSLKSPLTMDKSNVLHVQLSSALKYFFDLFVANPVVALLNY